MTDKHQVQLGDVQQTLFITLAGRARESARRRPVLRDPMAARIIESVDFDEKIYGSDWGDWITVLRTMIFDSWVRAFLADYPQGTVVELGAGLNTRFERVDNGTVHWIDIDLPDTVELRSKFWTDTERHRMITGSALDDDWYDEVAASPGPYFFVAEGVLVYLPEDEVRNALTALATRFPGALIAFDSYPVATMKRQHQAAQRKKMPARWAWGSDDPTTFTRSGLELIDMTTVTNPPADVRTQLSAGRKLMLRVLDPLVQGAGTLTLFRAGSR